MVKLGERWTRNPDGTTEKVPADMSFEGWREKFVEDLTSAAGADKINSSSFIIGRSVGAKAKNYEVIDKQTGLIYQFVEGTQIKNPIVFAGYKGVKPLREETVEGLVKEFGGTAGRWQHAKGIGVLDVGGEEVAAVLSGR